MLKLGSPPKRYGVKAIADLFEHGVDGDEAGFAQVSMRRFRLRPPNRSPPPDACPEARRIEHGYSRIKAPVNSGSGPRFAPIKI